MSSQKMSNEQLVLRIKAGENVADNMPVSYTHLTLPTTPYV